MSKLIMGWEVGSLLRPQISTLWNYLVTSIMQCWNRIHGIGADVLSKLSSSHQLITNSSTAFALER